MSNETKRDVFNEVLDEWQVDETMPDANWKYPDFKLVRIKEERFKDRYDAALPDDLPVIPELISKYLKMWKYDHGDLFQAFDEGTSASLDGTKWESVQDWFSDAKDSFDTFARAWVLGVWRVEETGEIVKLEAEK